jgi:hypothetical protein
MPVTIKLSRKFYDKLGEDVANEFVNALNTVDTSYRSELRDIIGQQFVAFEAKQLQRLTEFRADIDQRFSTLRADFLTHRADMDQRLAGLDVKWTERWTALDAKLDRSMERLKSELLRWMFGFWISTLVGLGALYMRS